MNWEFSVHSSEMRWALRGAFQDASQVALVHAFQRLQGGKLELGADDRCSSHELADLSLGLLGARGQQGIRLGGDVLCGQVVHDETVVPVEEALAGG